MIDHSTLDQAVAKGILDAGQRQALIDLATESRASAAPSAKPDGGPISGGLSVDDQMRLVGGGNDIFVAVGIILLFAGVQFALAAMFPDGGLAAMIAITVASWLVAEVITRQKRMRLSSTLLALIFTVAVALLLTNLLRDRIFIPGQINAFSLLALRSEADQIALILGGGLIIAAALYFARFKVPVLAGVIAVAVTGLAFLGAIVFYHDQLVSGAVAAPRADQLADILADALAIPLLCGLTIFIVAVILDLRDRERQTVWSDCAFWLHVVSAPLLVHPLFILATGQEVLSGQIEPGVGAAILLGVMMAGFVLVALAIDRRSLLAPTLAYFGSVGIYYLVNGAANTTGIPP
ncbi:MAG: hypothetical protein RID59_19710, partial [Hoeflea sp.]